MNTSDATGAVSRYGRQSRGLGERMTSSPPPDEDLSGGELVLLRQPHGLAAVGHEHLGATRHEHTFEANVPYTFVYGSRVRNTCLYPGFRTVLAARAEAEIL